MFDVLEGFDKTLRYNMAFNIGKVYTNGVGLEGFGVPYVYYSDGSPPTTTTPTNIGQSTIPRQYCTEDLKFGCKPLNFKAMNKLVRLYLSEQSDAIKEEVIRISSFTNMNYVPTVCVLDKSLYYYLDYNRDYSHWELLVFVVE